MLENTKDDSGEVFVTLGAAACMLSLLVLMGLKLRWFRARMTFDKPPKAEETPYVGVYRSNFADAFDYRRPSELPPIPAHLNAFNTSGTSEQMAGSSQDKQKSMPELTTVTELNEKKPKPVKEAKEPKVKSIKEPKVVAVKAPKVKAVKEPKVKTPKEPKDVAVKEPKVKAQKEPKVKVVKEPKVKEKIEPKVKEVKPAKEKGSKKKKGVVVESEISQNNAFPHVQSSNPQTPPPLYDGATNNAVKTFSTMQTQEELTPIPKRVIRNPVAMGAKVYKPPPRGMMIGDSTYDTIDVGGDNDRRPKTWGSSEQYLYDMDEESET